MADLLDLTVAEAAAKIAAGEISADEYGAAWRDAAAGDDLNAYLWRAEAARPGDWNGAGESAPAGEGEETPYGANPPAPADSGPLAGVPVAIKDIFCTEGVPTTAGSKILEGYRPPYTATAVRKLTAAGARVLGKTNMDEFAMGSSNENSAYGPVRNPWDRERVPGGSSGGSAAAVAGGPRPGGARHRHRRLDPPARLALRHRRAEADLRRDLALRDDRLRLLARPVRARSPATSPTRRCSSASWRARIRSTRPRSGSTAAIALPTREDLAGLRFGVPKELGEADGIDARRARAVFEATLARIEELGGDGRRDRPAARRARHLRLLRDRPGRGLRQPRPLRRRPLRAARRRRRGPGRRCTSRPAPQGFGAEVKRRIMLGTYALSSGYYDAYYGQAQKVRTRIARDFDAAFDERRLPAHPDLALGRLRARGRRPTIPLAMYLTDFFTVPMSLAGIPAISIPAGLAAPEARRGRELPVGFQIAGPAFGEQQLLDAAHALEGALGFDAAAGDAPLEGRVPWLSTCALEPVIGLEIHVQLATRTKMFCGCELEFGDEPNIHTCPICLAHPGVLPVPNEEAIRYGAADRPGARLRDRPALDLPPQELLLSRHPEGLPDQPVRHPDLRRRAGSATSASHRAHLEEDAAKTIHAGESGRIHGSAASLVDFNRGGTPLVEIVTEPDLRGAAEAREWARLLRETVRQLGVSDVNMEEGSLRFDANVSVRPVGSDELGTKTELKNMNSFRFVAARDRGRARAPARDRRRGGEVEQETLHFDPASGELTSLRSKEEAHDYRYFPEPDLVAIVADRGDARGGARLAAGAARRAPAPATKSELGLDDGAGAACSPPTRSRPSYFEAVARRGRRAAEPRVVANWVTGELTAALRAGRRRRTSRPGQPLADLVGAVARKTDLPRGRQAGAGGRSSPTASRRRPRSSSARASPRWGVTTASWPASSPPRSRPTRPPPSRSAAATARRSAP